MSDTSSSDDDESRGGNPLHRFGNPLKEIEPAEAVKKPVAVHEQIVTDEQGRRRFHGAFTGGFSAGYYNTVGTKDGWTPSTFKSSRKEKQEKNVVFQPEDFMDEEALCCLGHERIWNCTKKNCNKNRFYTKSQKRGLWNQEYFPRKSDRDAWHGHAELTGDACKKDWSSVPFPEEVTFAPKDATPIDFTPKDNNYGLGYTRLDPTLALHNKIENTTGVSSTMAGGKKLSIKGKAFGVGAYEDEDDDIYARDSIANYDIAMHTEQEKDKTYGWSKPTLAIEEKKNYIGNLEDLMKGFKLSGKSQSCLRKIYKPPNIPQDFDVNRRKKISGILQSKKGNDTSSTIGVHLNAIDRQNKLGEEKLFKATDSVFDLMRAEDRERLKHAKEQIGKPKKEKSPSPEPKLDKEIISHDELRSQGKALFQPFAARPEKQKRYEKYLENRKINAPDPYFGVDTGEGLTEWQRQEEKREFAASASIFQPLLSGKNSRFTSQTDKLEAETKGGLQVSKDAGGDTAKMQMFGFMTRDICRWHPDPIVCKRFNVPDPYPDSDIIGVPTDELPNERGVFDPFSSVDITQARKPEHVPIPSKTMILVNTKNPSATRATNKNESRWDKKPVAQGPSTLSGKVVEPTSHVEAEQTKSVYSEDKKTETESESIEPMEATEETKTIPEKPPIDFFKSIFASSDESSSSSDDESENVDIDNIGMGPMVKNIDHNNFGTNDSITPVGKSMNPQIKFVSKANRTNKSNSLTATVKVNNENNKTQQIQNETRNNPLSLVAKENNEIKPNEDLKPTVKISTSKIEVKPPTSSDMSTNNVEDDDGLFGPALPPPRALTEKINSVFMKSYEKIHISTDDMEGSSDEKNKKSKKKKHKHKVKKKKKHGKKHKKG